VIEIAEGSGDLDSNAIEQLREALPHLVRDTPKTQAAAFKVAGIVVKLGSRAKPIVDNMIAHLATKAAMKILKQ